MSARDAFTKWAKGHSMDLDPAKFPSSGATFDVTETEWSWNTWKSAWLAAKADDAEICEEFGRTCRPFDNSVSNAAAAIRATIDGGR